MTQYINKNALVAEIENRKLYLLGCGYPGQGEYEEGNIQGRLDACDKFLSFLDTLEVKEVDLEKEIDKELDRNWYGEYIRRDRFSQSAKHFFELGLNAQ